MIEIGIAAFVGLFIGIWLGIRGAARSIIYPQQYPKVVKAMVRLGVPVWVFFGPHPQGVRDEEDRSGP